MNADTGGIRSIASNSLQLMAKNIVVYLVRFLYVAIVARFLGPELYGLLVYGQTWYLVFLPFAFMGLQLAISRLIGRDNSRAREISTQTLSLRILASVLTALVCAGSGWLLVDSREVALLITVFSIALVFRSLAQWANEIFNAFESSWRTLRQESLFRSVEVVLGILVLVSGGGIYLLAFVHSMVWLLQALRGIYLVHREYTGIHIDLSLGRLKPVLLMAIPFLAGAFLTNWELQGAIILFHNHAGEGQASGSFALAIQIMIILSVLFASITIAALPVLSRSAQRKDHKDLLFVDTLMRAGFLGCAMVGIAGMALGPSLVIRIFGEQYLLAARLIGPALWCLLPFSLASTLTAFTIARGYYYLSPACHLAGAVVLTVSLPILVAEWGATGGIIAAGLGLGTSAICLIMIAVTRNWLDALKALVYPALCVAALLATYNLLEPFSVWLALPASLLVLLGLAHMTGTISAADRQLVKQLMDRSRAQA